jgi:hypothetical protein
VLSVMRFSCGSRSFADPAGTGSAPIEKAWGRATREEGVVLRLPGWTPPSVLRGSDERSASR